MLRTLISESLYVCKIFFTGEISSIGGISKYMGTWVTWGHG